MAWRIAFFVAASLPAIMLHAADAPAPDAGPDTVQLQSSVTGGRATLHGTIVDYTGRELTIETAPAAPIRSYPADDIVRVDTPQVASHVRGAELLAEGKADDARLSLESALTEETRTWVQREILALLVRSALIKGDYASAGSRFALLVKSDPDTRHFGLIPLLWTTEPPDPVLANTARFWMSQEDPLEKLLGAAVLLTDPEQAASAGTVMRRLTANPDRRIQRLAQAQVWRTRAMANDLSQSELTRWQAHIDGMPEPLRRGPLYVLGRGFAQIKEEEASAMTLAWLPLVYREDQLLAARAGVAAGDAFSRGGQILAAAAMYRQVAEEFDQTAFAKEAAARLDQLAKPAPK